MGRNKPGHSGSVCALEPSAGTSEPLAGIRSPGAWQPSVMTETHTRTHARVRDRARQVHATCSIGSATYAPSHAEHSHRPLIRSSSERPSLSDPTHEPQPAPSPPARRGDPGGGLAERRGRTGHRSRKVPARRSSPPQASSTIHIPFPMRTPVHFFHRLLHHALVMALPLLLPRSAW